MIRPDLVGSMRSTAESISGQPTTCTVIAGPEIPEIRRFQGSNIILLLVGWGHQSVKVVPPRKGQEMSFGVVYAVMRSPGGRFLNEAANSAQSLKQHNPDVPVQLVTDLQTVLAKGAPFDSVKVAAESPPKGLVLRAKIDALSLSKFRRTLFLDSDTYVCGRIRQVFQIADYYDVAMAYAPRRVDPEWQPDEGAEIPSWLPEFNSGVILLGRSERAAKFLHEWRQLYMKYGKWNDQISLRVALFHGLKYGLKLYPLPPEYNCRTICMAQLGGKALILHGRGDMKKACSQINGGTGIRVYIPDIGLFRRKDWKHVKS